MSPFTIRAARPEDFETIIRLWESLDRHVSLEDRPEYLATFHDFAPDLFLVAEVEGCVVGTVIGGWDGWRAQLARLTVHPDYQRQDIASTLVCEIEQRLRLLGAQRLYALVDRRSEAAIPFWEATGYAANENVIQYSRNFAGGEGT